LADPWCLGGKRDLPQDIENLVSKEAEQQDRYPSENRTKDFAAIQLGSAECAKQTDHQQSRSNCERQKIRPRKIARDRKLREKFETDKSADGHDEAAPKRPFPFAFHVDLADPSCKIHR